VKKRKIIPVAIALVAIIAVSGVAYAYWTASGTGSGSASAAAGVSTLTADSATLNDMYPGDSSQPIVITVHNPSNQAVYVTSVTVSVGDSTPSGCGAANFTVLGSTEAVGKEIAASGSLTLTSPLIPPTIQFKDLSSNQDVCKGVKVNLSFSIL
jgi:PKD repeat protein